MKGFILELKSCCLLSVVHSVQVKMMLLLFIWMLMVSFHTGSSEDLLTPFKEEMTTLEGDTVTLSCNYSGSVYNVYWYQQKSSSSPQLLIAEYSENTGRRSMRHDKKTKEFHLQISSAAVSDSAVYYCAPHGQCVGCEDLSPVNKEEFSLEDGTVTLSYKYHKLSTECRAQKDNVLQLEGDVTATEGDAVTLGCLYNSSSTSPYLYWYKQDGNNSPTFILNRVKLDEGNTPDETEKTETLTVEFKAETASIFKMESVHLHLFSALFLITLTGVGCEDLSPVNKEEFSLENGTVTLSYKYPKLSPSDYFFWYRQYPGKPPELLISHSASGQVGNNPVPGLKVKVEEKQISMNISSAAVSDSAVYYCAVKPTVTGK
ncbi:uncharacterized protein LOC113129620 [Mastacembelus armatus]|uniref:uncharacterized protein LOC113129620 n=1 Tax=Mastacembelus armatus TaxID=205130 RepID=UPI000E4541ED|nr:uncharacterized protein LOC113129620 [Mastacembelus armatus]